MSSYKVILAYTNKHGNIQHFVAKDVVASSVIGSITLTMADFFSGHGDCEIIKAVVELKRSTRKAIGDIYRGN